jgi:Xaa-Pro dipeptidase
MSIDYPARLAAARARMAAQDIGLMFLTAGANLFYLTGIRRHEEGGTDHNAYGDWAVGGYIGPSGGITLVAPRMGGEYFDSEARGRPWIDMVQHIDESESPLDVMRQSVGRYIPAAGSGHLQHGKKIALDDRAWAKTMLAFRQLLPAHALVLASDVLMPLRMIKSRAELEIMRKAGALTEDVFAQTLARLKAGVSEHDIAAEIDYQFKAHGAEHTSFVTGMRFIGAGGAQGEGVGRVGMRRLTPGDTVTFDMGCVYEGYCSDFGRTAFLGEPPAEFLRIHEIVLGSQRAGMEAMKAGQVTGAQVNAAARNVIEAEGFGQYFTHRLGHGIGVSVHEPPWLDVVEQSLLQANMTFTVEPSIYIPGRFGNRVEDIVLVTESGGVSLYNADRRLYVIS